MIGGIEQGTGTPTNATPIYTQDTAEIRTAEVETAPMKDDCVAAVVDCPKASAIAGILANLEEVTMQMDVAKAERAALADNKFLSHYNICRSASIRG